MPAKMSGNMSLHTPDQHGGSLYHTPGLEARLQYR